MIELWDGQVSGFSAQGETPEARGALAAERWSRERQAWLCRDDEESSDRPGTLLEAALRAWEDFAAECCR